MGNQRWQVEDRIKAAKMAGNIKKMKHLEDELKHVDHILMSKGFSLQNARRKCAGTMSKASGKIVRACVKKLISENHSIGNDLLDTVEENTLGKQDIRSLSNAWQAQWESLVPALAVPKRSTLP